MTNTIDHSSVAALRRVRSQPDLADPQLTQAQIQRAPTSASITDLRNLTADFSVKDLSYYERPLTSVGNWSPASQASVDGALDIPSVDSFRQLRNTQRGHNLMNPLTGQNVLVRIGELTGLEKWIRKVENRYDGTDVRIRLPAGTRTTDGERVKKVIYRARDGLSDIDPMVQGLMPRDGLPQHSADRLNTLDDIALSFSVAGKGYSPQLYDNWDDPFPGVGTVLKPTAFHILVALEGAAGANATQLPVIDIEMESGARVLEPLHHGGLDRVVLKNAEKSRPSFTSLDAVASRSNEIKAVRRDMGRPMHLPSSMMGTLYDLEQLQSDLEPLQAAPALKLLKRDILKGYPTFVYDRRSFTPRLECLSYEAMLELLETCVRRQLESWDADKSTLSNAGAIIDVRVAECRAAIALFNAHEQDSETTMGSKG